MSFPKLVGPPANNLVPEQVADPDQLPTPIEAIEEIVQDTKVVQLT